MSCANHNRKAERSPKMRSNAALKSDPDRSAQHSGGDESREGGGQQRQPKSYARGRRYRDEDAYGSQEYRRQRRGW